MLDRSPFASTIVFPTQVCFVIHNEIQALDVSRIQHIMILHQSMFFYPPCLTHCFNFGLVEFCLTLLFQDMILSSNCRCRLGEYLKKIPREVNVLSIHLISGTLAVFDQDLNHD